MPRLGDIIFGVVKNSLEFSLLGRSLAIFFDNVDYFRERA
jgi:hypothetical protein